ncbi:hypothetical protein AM588_10004049 [Phytophthora nicotianae]|uniref:Uncharacterized protein n=1 Tax=Phytophthora nicotianae TaxID=4792 RepID=A0A0W8DA38_PHYNI|nr:hypothetical protein AM588_10004049 [Phytophthora nicotianae]
MADERGEDLARLLLSRWSIHSGEEQFASISLFCEMKLNEAKRMASWAEAPNRFYTVVVSKLITYLAKRQDRQTLALTFRGWANSMAAQRQIRALKIQAFQCMQKTNLTTWFRVWRIEALRRAYHRESADYQTMLSVTAASLSRKDIAIAEAEAKVKSMARIIDSLTESNKQLSYRVDHLENLSAAAAFASGGDGGANNHGLSDNDNGRRHDSDNGNFSPGRRREANYERIDTMLSQDDERMDRTNRMLLETMFGMARMVETCAIQMSKDMMDSLEYQLDGSVLQHLAEMMVHELDVDQRLQNIATFHERVQPPLPQVVTSDSIHAGSGTENITFVAMLFGTAVASGGAGSLAAMSLTEFNKLIKDCFTGDKHITQQVVDNVYRAALHLDSILSGATNELPSGITATSVIPTKAAENGSDEVTEAEPELSGRQFADALVRLAAIKYAPMPAPRGPARGGHARAAPTPTLPLDERFRLLMEQDILPNALRSQRELFRAEVAQPKVREVFQRHKPVLQRIFRYYASMHAIREQNSTLSLSAFIVMARDCKLIGSFVTEHTLKQVLVNLQRDDGSSPAPATGTISTEAELEMLRADFSDFQEALAALTEYVICNPYVALHKRVDQFLQEMLLPRARQKKKPGY